MTNNDAMTNTNVIDIIQWSNEYEVLLLLILLIWLEESMNDTKY